MKQIIPFKKELPFKTKVSEITSISLERDINIESEGIITGAFHITGDYKMNEGSINRENFSFDLPFDITLDPRYDFSTVTSDIEDFYYDVINEDTLKVNIDLYVEAEYLPESEVPLHEEEPATSDEEEREVEDTPLDTEEAKEETSEENTREIFTEVPEVKEETFTELAKEEVPEPEELLEEELPKIEPIKTITEELPQDGREESSTFATDLFSNLDDTETYTTYYVYIVKEEDTIDKIITKYGVTKEDLESYNDITELKPGDKVIVPKTSG